ncbi:MAG: Hsp20/alpha crystallin family protein [Clostridia bacterium]|nr:Hsp20/alpha crystallin family protein [Clostridia bacterium]
MMSMMPYYNNKPARTATSMFSDPFFRSFFDTADLAGSAVMRVDVQENDSAYLMEVDLPGVKQEDIEITVNDDVLTISAQMNTHKKESKKNYIYNERRVGSYTRRFNLEGIAQDNITATYENGTLTLNLPKVEPAKAPEPRKIAIN